MDQSAGGPLAPASRRRFNAAVQSGYELFDHTADMGVRVRAATMGDLIAPAVSGFYATIGELVAAVDATPWRFQGQSPDGSPDLLLRDFLTELLVLFERDHRILTRIDAATLNETMLSVEGIVTPVDTERSVMSREVKAVTYHELYIRPVGGGFEAAFIVDI